MTYKVELIHTEEGYSIGCPELPGCWSEGQTEEEATENIKSAIFDYLAVTRETAPVEVFEKKILFVDVPDAIVAEPKPFKVVPIPISLPHFTKVEDLLDILEGPDRLY